MCDVPYEDVGNDWENPHRRGPSHRAAQSSENGQKSLCGGSDPSEGRLVSAQGVSAMLSISFAMVNPATLLLLSRQRWEQKQAEG